MSRFAKLVKVTNLRDLVVETLIKIDNKLESPVDVASPSLDHVAKMFDVACVFGNKLNIHSTEFAPEHALKDGEIVDFIISEFNTVIDSIKESLIPIVENGAYTGNLNIIRFKTDMNVHSKTIGLDADGNLVRHLVSNRDRIDKLTSAFVDDIFALGDTIYSITLPERIERTRTAGFIKNGADNITLYHSYAVEFVATAGFNTLIDKASSAYSEVLNSIVFNAVGFDNDNGCILVHNIAGAPTSAYTVSVGKSNKIMDDLATLGFTPDFHANRQFITDYVLDMIVVENCHYSDKPIYTLSSAYTTSNARKLFLRHLYNGAAVYDNLSGHLYFINEKLEKSLREVVPNLVSRRIDNFELLFANDEIADNVVNLAKESTRKVSDLVNINAYNHNPSKLNFLKTDADNKDDLLFLGAEIELGDNRNHESQHTTLPGLITTAITKGLPNMYVMRDGSVSNGFEMATHPATLSAHLDSNMFDYDNGFRIAKALGYTSSDNDMCGLHVHINKDYFTNPTVSHALMNLFLKRNWDDVIRFTRRSVNRANQWASIDGISKYLNKFENIANGSDNMSAKDVLQKLNVASEEMLRDFTGNKYRAINSSKSKTFEFRIFRGTLNETAYKATLAFVDELARTSERAVVSLYEGSGTLKERVVNMVKVFSTITLKDIVESANNEYLTEYYNNLSCHIGDNPKLVERVGA